jgi:hypothetical protein
MKKISFFSVFCFLMFLFACNHQKSPSEKEAAPPEKQEDFTLVPGQRIGLITAENSSRQAVLNAYGADAKVDSVYLGEGFFAEGVVLYPDDPKRRVEFYWDPEVDSLHPYITIRGMRPDEGGTAWKTDSGITIGTPIAEVERINGKPFSLSGFGWDYGGRVTDWNGGKLTGLGLGFDLPDNQDYSNEIMGERALSSDDPNVRKSNPVVSMLMLDFQQPK